MGVRQPPSRCWESLHTAVSFKSHTLKHRLAQPQEWWHQYVSAVIISSGSLNTIHQRGYDCKKFTCMTQHCNCALLGVMLFKALANGFFSLAYVYAVKQCFCASTLVGVWNATNNIKTASPRLSDDTKGAKKVILHKKDSYRCGRCRVKMEFCWGREKNQWMNCGLMKCP